jgi:peptide/nickel transport system permease protein
MTATALPSAAPAARRPPNDSRSAAIALRVRRLIAAIGRILAALIPVFLLGSLFTYVLGAISGLTPAYLQLGEGATPSAVKALDQQWGLNRPFFVQYFSWLGHVLTGNFGNSWINNFPVTQLLGNRAIISVSAAGVALILGVVFGFGLGALAVRFQSTWVDRVITVFTSTISVMPPFIVGILLIDVFAVWLRWLPSSGFMPLSSGFGPWFTHIILPAIALSFDTIADVARQLRVGLVTASRQNYATGATVRGLSGRRVFFVHVLRNGIGPAVAVLGLKFPNLLGGAVVTEAIFQLSGYGQFAAQSAIKGDVPSVQAVLVVSVVLVVLFNLLVNIILARLIPTSASRGL